MADTFTGNLLSLYDSFNIDLIKIISKNITIFVIQKRFILIFVKLTKPERKFCKSQIDDLLIQIFNEEVHYSELHCYPTI